MASDTERIAAGTVRGVDTDLHDHRNTGTNRVAVLKELFDAETRRPQVSTRRVTEVAAEIRMNEANINRWVTALNPEVVQAKSLRHQHAANARWHGSGSA